MTIGVVTGQPTQKFAFPRSYIDGISIKSGVAVPVWASNRMDLWDTAFTSVYWSLYFKYDFWEWSSNRWTIDYVLEHAWYGSSDPATGSPLPVYCTYKVLGDPPKKYIEVAAFGLGSENYEHLLPTANQPYWANGT